MSDRKSKRRLSTADHQKMITALSDAVDEFDELIEDEDRAAIIARFDGYSERNALLIAMQRPDATDVSGFVEWLTRGREVRHGETSIRILAKAGGTPEEKDPTTGEVTRKGRNWYKLASIFDVKQTRPKVPDDFPVRPLYGRLIASAKELATCGECGRSWDDAVSTAYTPAPSARCPFEQFHED